MPPSARLIVIDDADFFHLGASIKDAALKKGFMFSKVEEPIVVAALRTAWAKEWGGPKSSSDDETWWSGSVRSRLP